MNVSEKNPLKVVFKWISQEINEEEVKGDFEQNNYKVQEVRRMKGRNGSLSIVLLCR